MWPIFLLAGVPSVLGHGGMVWPPTWQDGNALPLDEVWNNKIQGNPPIKDPKTGRWIDNAKSWLTDQSYTGGHGEFPNGTHYKEGPTSEPDWDNLVNIEPGFAWQCWKKQHPWAAPGRAPELGEGCGIHGGNPYGCPYYGEYGDIRPPGSVCLPPPWTVEHPHRGTTSYGSRAIDIDFPQARTTKWVRGSTVPVAFVAIYHAGGYNYRLCKMPSIGKIGLTEKCFQRNILKFAENVTYWRESGDPWWQDPPTDMSWKTSEKKTDVTEGTYPEGSAWRYWGPGGPRERFFKDLVVVPEDLEPGEYVLSWRWDAALAPQVWVSCANIEIV